MFPYIIILRTCQSFVPPSSTPGGDRHKHSGNFLYKTQFWKLLFELFFVQCVLLAVLGPKLNVETGTQMESTESSHSVTSQCCAPTGSSKPCRIITLHTFMLILTQSKSLSNSCQLIHFHIYNLCEAYTHIHILIHAHNHRGEYFNNAHIEGFFSPFWKYPFSIFFSFFWTCSGWVLKDESKVCPTGNPSHQELEGLVSTTMEFLSTIKEL